MAWVPAEDDGTTWGYSLLNGQDWVYPSEGTTQGVRQMVTADGQAWDVRFHSGDDVKIEIPEESFAALGEFPRYFRSLGLGKLRKDLSLPLMPSGETIWVQSALDDATLVVRPAGADPAFFRLGPLGVGALRSARMQVVSVVFFVGTNVLPDPSMRKEARAGMAGKAWGGLVACTTLGGDQAPGAGSAWQHHADVDPSLLLEGVDAARAALERSPQGHAPD